MGQRTGSESLTRIISAFWGERTWSQAELSRYLGVTVRTLRKHLDELTSAGWPLHREDDHPHVYWSIPKDWFPGGVALGREEIASLLHLLARLPESAERERVIGALKNNAPAPLLTVLDRVLPPRSSPVAEQHLPAVLDALGQRKVLKIRYFTASRGAIGTRLLSVQRVLAGPPARFIAYCHTANDLRWFRLENIEGLSPSPEADFVEVDDAQVEEVVSRSVDGFFAGPSVRVTFFVRAPESRWVAKNLPEGLEGIDTDGGLLVDQETHGLIPIARFVVGLGKAAECRSPELAKQVRALAREALGED
jgi:predicted DNA-binding transcriptional regulator YafY